MRNIRPGDRYVVVSAAGIYKGEGTVEKVNSYTDTSTAVDILVSHDMTGQAPVQGELMCFDHFFETAGGILVRALSADSFDR